MKTKIIVSIIILILMLFSNSIYEEIQGPIESQIAVQQLEDSTLTYSLSRAIATKSLIINSINLMGFLIILFIWIKPIITFFKKDKKDEKIN